MDIYCGIDGTLNDDNASDTAATEPMQVTSFVKRIGLMNFDKHLYLAGSKFALTGHDSNHLAYQAKKWIMTTRGNATDPDNVRVFLGGFSRGGASALLTCNHLKSFGISVHGLFLFDAVDRNLFITFLTSRKVPNNVVHAFHAFRDPDADSRPEFGNCGVVGSNDNLKKRAFYCTHGGMGGWRFGSEQLREPVNYAANQGTLGLLNLVKAATTGSVSAMKYREPFSPNLITNVTPLQQLSGSLAAWNWMQGNVLAARGWNVAPNNTGPKHS